MQNVRIGTVEELNYLLQENCWFGNGKNFPIDHLHETSANSRWPWENIWGIYLTMQDCVWMAFWIAITSRQALKKRQIKYVSPDIESGDYIGFVEIYNPEGLALNDLFLSQAYLYLFNSSKYFSVPTVDISCLEETNKMEALVKKGFRKERIFKNDSWQDIFKPEFGGKTTIWLDDWQVAFVNFSKIFPDAEIVLEKPLIEELAKRVEFSPCEIGGDYIKRG